jgi:hypothetical protein
MGGIIGLAAQWLSARASENMIPRVGPRALPGHNVSKVPVEQHRINVEDDLPFTSQLPPKLFVG